MAHPNNNQMRLNNNRQPPIEPHPYFFQPQHPLAQYQNQYLRNSMMSIPHPMAYHYSPYGYPPPYTQYGRYANMPLLPYDYPRYSQMYQQRPQYIPHLGQSYNVRPPIPMKRVKNNQAQQVIEILSDQEQESRTKKQKQIESTKQKNEEKIQPIIQNTIKSQPSLLEPKISKKQQNPVELIKTKRIHKVKVKEDLPEQQYLKKSYRKEKSQKKKTIAKTQKTNKDEISEKKEPKYKSEERPHRDLIRYQDSHGRIRIGKDFQTNLPVFINKPTELIVWIENKLKNLASREIQSTMLF